MTSRRWMLWIGAAGAGVCIAFGAGAGVAVADTEAADGGGVSTSRSVDRDATQISRGPSRRSVDAETADAPAKPFLSRRAARAAAADDTSSRSPRMSLKRVFSPHRQDDPDSEDAAADAAEDAPVADEPSRSATRRQEAPASSNVAAQPQAPATPDVGAAAVAAPAEVGVDTVTGVKTGRAELTVPVGRNGFRTRADWYFPTQADGSVSATGVIWLQHGFMGRKFFYSELADTLAQQTNSIVVAPNLPSFPSLRCGGCWLNGVGTQEAVATMFLGERESLNLSATSAGLVGTLPEDFILSGHSAGGGLAAAAGGYYADGPTNDGALRGIVMFDGFSFSGVLPQALQSLDDPFVPVYQIAAPPQLGNLFGAATKELVTGRPGQFVGVTLANGSHVDSLIGGNLIVDFLSQLVTRFSPPGNTAAVYTLATGWINDLYQELGPTDGNGIYGDPDQYIVMGDTAAVVLSPPPVVDLDSYLGTWYEVGSVKQFFSIGLVNTTAVYSLNPDGSIKVENSGNYFFNNGPESTIVGAALPVDPANNKLNVRFFGAPSDNPPGNYWIVDLDPDYQWAIVSDRTGLSGFLLSRTRDVSDDLYQELLDRASVNGVRGRITPTRQPAADMTIAA